MVPARIRQDAAGQRFAAGRAWRRVRANGRRSPTLAWIHAVSVGEVLAIAPLVAEMRGRRDTGWWFRRRRTPGSGWRATSLATTNVFYFPLDFGLCITSLSAGAAAEAGDSGGDRVLAELFAAGAGERSAAGGGECAHQRPFVSALPAFGRTAAHECWSRWICFWRRARGTRTRLREVGAAAGRVEVTGNLKFDAASAGGDAGGDRGWASSCEPRARRFWWRAARWRTKRITCCRRSGWFWASIRRLRWCWRRGTGSALRRWRGC